MRYRRMVRVVIGIGLAILIVAATFALLEAR
jgi:hypothetical protein